MSAVGGLEITRAVLRSQTARRDLDKRLDSLYLDLGLETGSRAAAAATVNRGEAQVKT